MINPTKLENAYNDFINHLPTCAPDGIIQINVSLLQSFGLLNPKNKQLSQNKKDDIKRYFYIIETPEKITLFNEEFTVWIVPTIIDQIPATYTLIAINNNETPKLDVVFSASGIYNVSNIILSVLECFLAEIKENNALINKFEHS